MTLPEYLTAVLGRALNGYGPREVYHAVLLGAAEALNAGITTVFDWSNATLTQQHTDAVLEAYTTSGIRPAEPPGWLSVSQRAVWDRVTVELRAIHGEAFWADTDVIAAYVVAVDTMVTAAKELTRHGGLVAGRDGGMVRNPATIVYGQQANLVDRLASSLGLTPDSRSRMRRTADTDTGRSDVLSLEDFFANGPA